MHIDRRRALVGAGAALLAGTAATNPGSPAPALVLPLISGGQFDLAAQKGRVVVVNFWATWCVPCRTEMPALDAWYRRRKAEVEVLGVSADKPRDRDDVKKVMAPFAYPAGLKADARKDGFGSTNALPITYVIDRHGVIRNVLTPETGALTAELLDRLVKPLL